MVVHLFSCSVMSDSLRPHGLQDARLPCPSSSPRAYSNSCPLHGWCHPTISSSVVSFCCLQFFPASGSFLMILPSIFPSIKVCSNELAVHIRWPKYWNFSFCFRPSNEYSGLISFRIDWFDLLAVQGIHKRLLQHHSTNYQCFHVQPSLWSNSHIYTWLLEKP